jgi:hypothetical protein
VLVIPSIPRMSTILEIILIYLFYFRFFDASGTDSPLVRQELDGFRMLFVSYPMFPFCQRDMRFHAVREHAQAVLDRYNLYCRSTCKAVNKSPVNPECGHLAKLQDAQKRIHTRPGRRVYVHGVGEVMLARTHDEGNMYGRFFIQPSCVKHVHISLNIQGI